MVPGDGGPLPQLTQHYARAGRAGRLLHAPGLYQCLFCHSTWLQVVTRLYSMLEHRIQNNNSI